MPQDDYYFFFSYASENHKNANKFDSPHNYLDDFFDRLCRRVSDKTGRKASEVAYRDLNRLKMGDFWDVNLIEGLQKSRVVVAVLSPHYLDSEYCGKELAFFQRRWDALVDTSGDHMATHCIVPLYWENSPHCSKRRPAQIVEFFEKLQNTQEGMPRSYPTVGLSQFYHLEEKKAVESLCEVFSERIVELAERPHTLPILPNTKNFRQMESIYSRLTAGAKRAKVASGPAAANVMYLVGTRNEMKSEGIGDKANYGLKREDWQPFQEAPGATVGLLTEEGANQAGVTSLYNLEPTVDLVPHVLQVAKIQNSPVLLVLDREALRISDLASKLRDYDDINFPHCGLVTAGGAQTLDEKVANVFPFKVMPNYPNHIWSIPSNRKGYVDSVASVLGNLKRSLLQTAEPPPEVGGSSVPSL
jgi:TIR domain